MDRGPWARLRRSLHISPPFQPLFLPRFTLVPSFVSSPAQFSVSPSSRLCLSSAGSFSVSGLGSASSGRTEPGAVECIITLVGWLAAPLASRIVDPHQDCRRDSSQRAATTQSVSRTLPSACCHHSERQQGVSLRPPYTTLCVSRAQRVSRAQQSSVC